MRIAKALFVILACFATGQLSLASVVIHVENKATPFIQGGNGNTISVYAYTTATDNADRFFNSYLLAFDFAAAGKGTLTGVSNFTGTPNGTMNGNFFFLNNDPSFDNFDFAVTGDDSNNPNTINLKNHTSIATAYRLFDLTFDISLAAAPGVYNSGFVVKTNAQAGGSPFINELTIDSATVTIFDTSGGNFEIEAVPEPSTMALLALGLTGGAAYRRFRKRSPSKVPGISGPDLNRS